MTIRIENEWEREYDFEVDELLEELLKTALEYMDCPYEVEISVLLTGNNEMKEINRQNRNIDAPTDVLSFPMVAFREPCIFGGNPSIKEWLEGDKTHFSPEDGKLLLGDIVLSCDKVFEQAREYGHSVKRELSFLFIHGLLHLFGYDHMEEEGARSMGGVQEDILSRLGIDRSLNDV